MPPEFPVATEPADARAAFFATVIRMHKRQLSIPSRDRASNARMSLQLASHKSPRHRTAKFPARRAKKATLRQGQTFASGGVKRTLNSGPSCVLRVNAPSYTPPSSSMAANRGSSAPMVAPSPLVLAAVQRGMLPHSAHKMEFANIPYGLQGTGNGLDLFDAEEEEEVEAVIQDMFTRYIDLDGRGDL